jgi:hypothetical protein
MSEFQTVRDLGKAAGDGVTDDTAAINAFIAQVIRCAGMTLFSLIYRFPSLLVEWMLRFMWDSTSHLGLVSADLSFSI